MPEIPDSIEATIEQAKIATLSALADGITRIQLEMKIPEIALRAQSIAWDFTEILQEYGSGLKVLFPDTGAAALARRDWGETVFRVNDLGSRRTPIDTKIGDEDSIFLVVCPSAPEVELVERLCNITGDRPVILLIPQLEDVSIVGIGYAARQLRERFINTLESAYYLRLLEGGVVIRAYPSPWEVWVEKDDTYEMIAQLSTKPMGEELDLMVAKAINPPKEEPIPIKPQNNNGFFGNLSRLFKKG